MAAPFPPSALGAFTPKPSSAGVMAFRNEAYKFGSDQDRVRMLFESSATNLSGGVDVEIGKAGDVLHINGYTKTLGTSVNELHVANDAAVDNDLTVGHDVAVTNDLTVSHDATIANELTVQQDAYISGALQGQDVFATRDFSVTRDSGMGGDLTLQGLFRFLGNIAGSTTDPQTLTAPQLTADVLKLTAPQIHATSVGLSNGALKVGVALGGGNTAVNVAEFGDNVEIQQRTSGYPTVSIRNDPAYNPNSGTSMRWFYNDSGTEYLGPFVEGFRGPVGYEGNGQYSIRQICDGYVGDYVAGPNTTLNDYNYTFILNHGGRMETRGHEPLHNNAYALGGSGRLWSEVFANNAVINTSDERVKEDITQSLGLEFINALEPVEFTFKDNGRRRHQGLIAQQVLEVAKEFGYADETHANKSSLALLCWDQIPEEKERAKPGDGEDTQAKVVQEAYDRFGLRYGELIPPLISAVQTLSKEKDMLLKRVQQLEDIVLKSDASSNKRKRV